MSPLTLLNVQAAVVILAPLALAWWLRQRLAVSWRTWGWGALTFIASQLARLPFLYLLTILLAPARACRCRLPGGVLDQSAGPLADGGHLRGDGAVADAPTIRHRCPRLG